MGYRHRSDNFNLNKPNLSNLDFEALSPYLFTLYFPGFGGLKKSTDNAKNLKVILFVKFQQKTE
jgi:hypothetical protein